MNLLTTSSIGGAADTAQTSDKQKLMKAAQEFEAVLLQSLLESLQRSVGNLPGAKEDGTSGQYQSMGTEAMASALASGGGLGLGQMIVRGLVRGSESKGIPVPEGASSSH